MQTYIADQKQFFACHSACHHLFHSRWSTLTTSEEGCDRRFMPRTRSQHKKMEKTEIVEKNVFLIVRDCKLCYVFKSS